MTWRSMPMPSLTFRGDWIDMAQIGYSKKVLEHFMNPRNVGTIEDPDGYGKVGNPVCGDLMEMFISVKEEKRKNKMPRSYGYLLYQRHCLHDQKEYKKF
jgi:hypothetical protein